jgi:hypothetical protein
MIDYLKYLFLDELIIRKEDLNYVISELGINNLLLELKNLFKYSNNLNLCILYTSKFLFEIDCPICKCSKNKEIRYIDLYFYFYDILDVSCENCSKKNNDNDTLILENTFFYIQKFLDPCYRWPLEYPSYLKIKEIEKEKINKTAISDYINALPYQYFLNTLYWKAISGYKMRINNCKCQECDSSNELEVHHKTYKNHGSELEHLEDLILLCNKCHKKKHLTKQLHKKSKSDIL